MNNNIYLNFIYKLVKTNQIFEEAKIGIFHLNSKILKKDIIKKIIDVKKVIIKVEIPQNKFLLIEDLPINFFLAYSILIGDECEILSFKNELNEEIICSKDLFLKIRNKIKYKNLNKYDFKNLNNVKFKFKFKETKIIKEIRNFTKQEKKINLNQIHIVKSESIEIFLPTIKINHLRMAKKLKIPTFPLIKNNFIKNSNINIFENQSLIENLNPEFIFEEKIEWGFEKKSHKKIFKDIIFEIIFYPNLKIIENKLNKIENKFISKNLLEKIRKKNKIVFSDLTSKIPLPLFKSNENQKFIEIIDEIDFKKISGRKFELNSDFLNEIYIQDLSGNKTIFENYYFDEKKLNYIKKLNNSEHIKYKDIIELIFKINYIENIEKISFEEEINKEEIKELLIKITHIIKKIILISVNINKIPIKSEANSNLQKYFESISNSLYIFYEDEKNSYLKKDLIKKINKKLTKILIVIKNQEIKFEDIYFLIQISLNLIKILFLIDTKQALKIKQYLFEFFNEEKILIRKNKINSKIEELVYSISLMNKISKNRKTYIILKDKNLLLKKIDKKNIKILGKYKFEKVIKINYKKLKQNFPYSYNEILKKIKENLKHNEIEFEFYLKNNKIKINKNYFKEFKIILDYKIVYENKYFKILIKN